MSSKKDLRSLPFGSAHEKFGVSIRPKLMQEYLILNSNIVNAVLHGNIVFPCINFSKEQHRTIQLRTTQNHIGHNTTVTTLRKVSKQMKYFHCSQQKAIV